MRTKQRIGVIVLGCAVGSVGVLGALIGWLGLEPGILVGLGIAALVVGLYLTVVGPWQRHWGATDEEIRRVLPGDELLRPGAPSTTRAITIDAAPEGVFPWLLQIGYGRGGWYSYDWIDNDGRRSVDRIDPDLQQLAVGDRIAMMPGVGPVVRELEPDHHIVSAGEADTWCLLVEPTADGRTRLLSRWRQDWPKSVATVVSIALADPGAFIMERKMLLTLRHLAERTSVERVGSRAADRR